ncbi:snRNA-activating protein complex subunit 4 [Tachysurus ichikawai]
MPEPGSRSYSARKRTPGSSNHVKTVAEIIAERNEKQSNRLLSPEFLDAQLPPQPAKIAISSLRRRKRKTKQPMQSASQKSNAGLNFPQTFVVSQPNTDSKGDTSVNVVQRILPLLQLCQQDASKIPQQVLPVPPVPVVVPAVSVMQPASCTTSSLSTNEPTKTAEEARTSKRKPKPTMKAQALLDDRKSKLSKKQAAKKQQNSSVTKTVTVLPQTTAWILTPAGLLPVAEIQLQGPGNENQAIPKNVQMIFQQPVFVNQSSCVAPTNSTGSDNQTSDLPGNNIKPLAAGSNLGQNCSPFSVSDNYIVSSFPSSSKTPSVISSSAKIIPQALPDTTVPSITGSAAQDLPSKSECIQNKTVTPMNPITLFAGSSSPVGTSQSITPSCSSDATVNVPSDSTVSLVTSTPSKTSAPWLNIFGPGTSAGPQSQSMLRPVSQPTMVNQNGSLSLINTARPCIVNEPPTATATVPSVPTNNKAPDINKSLPTENTAISSAYCLIPTSALPSVNGTTLAFPQFNFVSNPVLDNVGSVCHPTDQLGFNSPISPMITQIGPQTVPQQVSPQARKQSVHSAAKTSNPKLKQLTFDPSLIFFEQPTQVKNWLKGTGGITLPGLEENMPYLPPFVSSISTLTTLLKGRDSLLKSAVQLLPEEHRDNSEDEVKIAAVRKIVSERFKDNKAYLLLKARFLSCFTLPALLATINPCKELEDALAQEHNKDKVKPR